MTLTPQLQDKLRRINEGEIVFLTDDEAAAIGATHENALSEQDALDSRNIPKDSQPQ